MFHSPLQIYCLAPINSNYKLDNFTISSGHNWHRYWYINTTNLVDLTYLCFAVMITRCINLVKAESCDCFKLSWWRYWGFLYYSPDSTLNRNLTTSVPSRFRHENQELLNKFFSSPVEPFWESTHYISIVINIWKLFWN